ncbi:MAG: adenylyltransferase/cytidyltransferase family protein [Clostridia bacterium]|nr:adenylyltransferase/cytidyltransferase family protein [Clostridia bacterium]
MKKYKIGFTAGVFDLFHVGHLNLFERCKEQCDSLIVAVCDDDYVRTVKHKEPVFALNERVRIIGALKCVDKVVVVTADEVNDKTLVQKKFGFDVLFSGDDWKGSERYAKTEEQFSKIGVSIEYLPYTQGVSSSQIKDCIKKGEK